MQGLHLGFAHLKAELLTRSQAEGRSCDWPHLLGVTVVFFCPRAHTESL